MSGLPTTLLGVDFTSAPRARKPIMCAWGRLSESALEVERFVACTNFETFAGLLATPGPWLGAFDLPFGLPAAFVAEQGWPLSWPSYTEIACALSRAELVARCRAYAAVRPPGEKLAYRATDKPAQSSSAMWWMNPPVVLMFHAGVSVLKNAGVRIEPCHRRRDSRVVVEAYPGLIQKRLKIGSYKQDVVAKQTDAQKANRKVLIDAVIDHAPEWIGCEFRLSRSQRTLMIDDASGDHLDAALCVVQAAYAARRENERYGFPRTAPRHEGWIVMA